MKEEYIAKLTIKNLSNLNKIELDRLIGWLWSKLNEVRDEHERKVKKFASSQDPIYAKTYNSKLLK